MTSPTLGAAQLPDIFSTPTTIGSNPTDTGTRPVVSSNASATQGGDFSRLMNLQGRGRALEAKLAKQGSAVTGGGDPAATAMAQQSTFYAGELKHLRELVGSAPGGNARRALAAIVERLEGGGQLQPTDRARIKLAIAADDKRVDLSGANAYRHAILELDKGFKINDEALKDPSLVQDPARLAQFQQVNRDRQQVLEKLMQALGASKLDPSVAHALAGGMPKATGA